MTADDRPAGEPTTAPTPDAGTDDATQAVDAGPATAGGAGVESGDASGGTAVEDASELAAKLPGLFDEQPEIAAGLAFAGGLALAMVIKRLAS